MNTVIETREFIDAVPETLRNGIVMELAANPELGVVIPRTGGLRKARFAAQGKGKSGGIRVIYYYYNMDNPLIVLTAYAKGRQGNLTPAQERELSKLVRELKKEMKQ